MTNIDKPCAAFDWKLCYEIFREDITELLVKKNTQIDDLQAATARYQEAVEVALEALEKIADENNDECPHCLASKTIATFKALRGE